MSGGWSNTTTTNKWYDENSNNRFPSGKKEEDPHYVPNCNCYPFRYSKQISWGEDPICEVDICRHRMSCHPEYKPKQVLDFNQQQKGYYNPYMNIDLKVIS
ncbi:hypothetical protein PPL_05298 [Heterostelium album PN500]|uniref:Uncharacterized protein n=1 Tax=Heterostelium pallidum (strain ATCC 26659 / Pp 5 / PN500) TaxID=670386 RepID=D3BBB1_HETP5|nr:hypothetical protein PPL_05298 [Heterostelium album PN500]EFA81318.1 hypothetical protein PPL_05298 [Heterostelium album PN500]|eukprot:XP_020433436.1 hypothetical protein PPL_05298 [Heterostelium album PN500]